MAARTEANVVRTRRLSSRSFSFIIGQPPTRAGKRVKHS
jgi:hypothetical protein